MKKIIYIIATNHIAGTEIHVLNLIKKLKNKYDITIISNGGEFNKRILELGVKSKIIPMDSKYSILSIFKLYSEIKRNKYDIIHTHLAKSSFLGRIAGFLYNITSKKKSKIILTEHLWSDYNSDYPMWKNKLHLFFHKLLSYITDEIIVVSNAVKIFLVNEVKIKEKKITIIYNGTEDKNEKSIESDKKNNLELQFGVIGRLSKEKGHENLLEIIKNIEDKPFRLNIIGDGELRKSLEEKVKKIKIDKKINFKGFITNIDEEYRKLDALLMCSERECFPMVIIEAFKHGIPVISTNVGGVSEAIIDGKNGYLINCFDKKEYEKKLLKIFNKNVRIKLGKNARKSYENKYSLEKMIDLTQEIYEK